MNARRVLMVIAHVAAWVVAGVLVVRGFTKLLFPLGYPGSISELQHGVVLAFALMGFSLGLVASRGK